MQTKFTVMHILLLLILIITANLYGQGSIGGVVTDSVSNEKLFGASLILVGTALGDASNIEGEFQINNIPEGNYRLKISYIGYKTKIVQVEVSRDEYIKLDVTLVPDVVYGETVEITAQALGQVPAINQQRTSNTIINVISEEKIKELPDANAAEAIGRLPGVSILRSFRNKGRSVHCPEGIILFESEPSFRDRRGGIAGYLLRSEYGKSSSLRSLLFPSRLRSRGKWRSIRPRSAQGP